MFIAFKKISTYLLFINITQFCLSYDICTVPDNFDKNNQLHIAALVLARGGSKQIPLKNLAKISNVTLIERSLNIITSTNVFDSIWVSTDHNDIASVSEKSGAFVHWRAEFTATDKASSVIAVKEFIDKHSEVDIVALIQCTSPFIKTQYLKEAVSFFRRKNKPYQCIFSVTRSFKLRWIYDDNQLKPLNFRLHKRPRRQDWSGELIENGMFYFSTRKIINNGFLQNEK